MTDRREIIAKRVDFLLDAFAPWATVPADFAFPRSLLEFVLTCPRSWSPIHTCGRCGLKVPTFVTWSNDPDLPPSLIAFPECPSWGGRTSYGAWSGPQPEEVQE